MDAVALACCDLPIHLDCTAQIYERGGEKEYRFYRRLRTACLPVRHEGRVILASWGSRLGKLPRSGLTWQQSIDEGQWRPYAPEEIAICCSAVLHGGVWYRVRQGVRGLLVVTPRETAAYAIVEPASHYYKVMTRQDCMPVLIGERI